MMACVEFDGDGDRCGFVDNPRREQVNFADKIGVLLAPGPFKTPPWSHFRCRCQIDQTRFSATDPQLLAESAQGRLLEDGAFLQRKRRVSDLKALAGFEKSGHFFFNAPIGRGYDDGLVTAIHIVDMLDRNPGKSMAELYAQLPQTWGSPTMSPHCDDETKYGVAEKVTERLKAMQAKGELFTGQKIRDLVTVNGVRVTTEDGTWGLVRASSNKPELVVVVESPVSEARMRQMFAAVDAILRENPEVGAATQSDDLARTKIKAMREMAFTSARFGPVTGGLQRRHLSIERPPVRAYRT